jgi:hypothetical protein
MSWLTDRYIDGGAGINNLDWSNIAKDLGVAGAVYGLINPNDSSGIAKFLGTGGRQQPIGYTGGIPNYTATRELAPNAFAQTYTTPTGEVAPRVPGSVQAVDTLRILRLLSPLTPLLWVLRQSR